MNDFEEPIDLGLVRGDAEGRAGRIAGRVLVRVHRAELRQAVLGRLARAALPALLAAAASIAILLLTRAPAPEPDRFALLVLGPGPARAWVALNRAPDLNELTAMLGGAR